MVVTELTPDLIDDGARLVQKMDEMGIAPRAAFWMLFPDIDVWRLAISESSSSKEGPLKGYRTIQKAMERLDPEPERLSLDNIALLPPGAPLVDLLRAAIPTGPGISRIRLTNNVVDGQLIADALLYRIT